MPTMQLYNSYEEYRKNLDKYFGPEYYLDDNEVVNGAVKTQKTVASLHATETPGVVRIHYTDKRRKDVEVPWPGSRLLSKEEQR